MTVHPIPPSIMPLSEVLAQVAPVHRLLIVGAAPTTRHHPAPMPALDRYEGPEYRYLRRARSEDLLVQTQVLILSAAYGLLRPEQPIRDDGRRMTHERAGEIAEHIGAHLVAWCHARPACHSVCVNVIGSALPALADFVTWCQAHHIVCTVLTGAPGERLRAMRAWFTKRHEEPSMSIPTIPVRPVLEAAPQPLCGELIMGHDRHKRPCALPAVAIVDAQTPHGHPVCAAHASHYDRNRLTWLDQAQPL